MNLTFVKWIDVSFLNNYIYQSYHIKINQKKYNNLTIIILIFCIISLNYCVFTIWTESMNKFQKKTWRKLILNLRIVVPLIFHIFNISIVDFYTNTIFKLQTDISTLLFCIIVNTIIGCVTHLLPFAYRPRSLIKEGLIYVSVFYIVLFYFIT